MQSLPHIEVEVYRSVRPSPSQLASATVRLETSLGPVTIHDCRLLQNKAGVLWFALPSFSIQQAGSRQYEYRPTIEVSPDLLQEVSVEALRAYRTWSNEHNATNGASNVLPQPSR